MILDEQFMIFIKEECNEQDVARPILTDDFNACGKDGGGSRRTGRQDRSG
jgi:hypothetical protein